MVGAFSGDCVVVLLDDGRRVKLAQPFGYTDPAAIEWSVPKDAIVDGASIPQPLWGLIGGPFEGKYRAASVIHDWYCDLRTRPWEQVHRVFYDGMITSGVDPIQAKIMYYAVQAFGPRWSATVVSNANLGHEASQNLTFGVLADLDGIDADTGDGPVEKPPTYSIPFNQQKFDAVAELIKAQNPELVTIDRLAEQATAP